MVQRSTLGKNGKFAIALSLYSSYISHHSPKNNTKAPVESENKSSVTMTHQDKKPVVYYLENDLISSIKKCNIRYLDERPSGHLWIFGAVIPFVRECKRKASFSILTHTSEATPNFAQRTAGTQTRTSILPPAERLIPLHHVLRLPQIRSIFSGK